MDAEKITHQSKSNLALAFVSLDRGRRADITTFYAFCRVIDDIADSAQLSLEEKRRALNGWRTSLKTAAPAEPQLVSAVRALMDKYAVAPGMLEEIIAGVEMDLSISRYASFDELRLYCYRVASAVGLVSIEIFGYRNFACREYAVELGLALQTTNIIRDVGKDLRIGRIYLPRQEMEQFAYSEEELRAESYNDRFVALMEFQAARSKDFFQKAAAVLPLEDRRSMRAAEIMARIYRALLQRIEADRFQVFRKEYRLNRLEKAWVVATQLVGFR